METFKKSIDELVGNTPIMELTAIEKKYELKARLFAKLECFNPTGSVKDRAAKAMLDDAEERGLIQKGSTIIEPTSGNTGIGLAAVGRARGYKVVIVMPENMSEERKKLMTAYGAKLVQTSAAEGMQGAIERAKELQKNTPNSFIPDQFSNPANARAHFISTAPEIYEALEGNVDVFVAGVGTGGTITGVGEYLKGKNPNVKIVAVEPFSSPVLSGGKKGAHQLQGIGAGFIPKVLNREIIDVVSPVKDDEAFKAVKTLAESEGLFVGISSGAAFAAALQETKRAENAGKTVVVLFPDGGNRYLSMLG